MTEARVVTPEFETRDAAEASLRPLDLTDHCAGSLLAACSPF